MFEVHEPVNVWVLFRGNLIEPWCFFWKGRKIKVDTINLVHTSKEGNSTLYHFSLSAAGNYYQLEFDLKKMSWFLEAVEED